MKRDWESGKIWIWLMILNSLALIIFKFPNLTLPYFWDEAFPYSYAVNYLHNHTLSPFPNAIPQDFSTGHPTLFYFLSAGWGRIFGSTPFAYHSFALVISVFAQWSLFSFGKNFVNAAVGCAAALMMTWQSTFLAQSGMLLPEVMLCLWVTLAFNAWIKQKYFLYFLAASAAVLTKESGFIVAFTIGCWTLAEGLFFKKPGDSFAKNFKRLLLAATPVITFAAFFILQKIQMGWFFFPRHLAKVEGDALTILGRAKGFVIGLLFGYGRYVPTVLVLAATIWAFLSGLITKDRMRKFFPLFFYPLVLISFSMLNYYNSTRYVLSATPFIFLAFAAITWVALKNYRKWTVCTWAPMFIYPLVTTLLVRLPNDSNLGYADAIRNQQDVIRYCEENNWQNRVITTQFILYFSLVEGNTCYLSDPLQPFSKVSVLKPTEPDLFIYYNHSSKQEFDALKKEIPMHLLKRFTKGRSNFEIWESDQRIN